MNGFVNPNVIEILLNGADLQSRLAINLLIFPKVSVSKAIHAGGNSGDAYFVR